MDVKPPYANYKMRLDSLTENADSGGIYPYVHILRNRKGIIVLCVIVSLFLAFFVNLTQKAVYRSSVELILQAKDSSKALNPNLNETSFFNDPTFLLTQERLIRGPRLAGRVVEKLEKPENRNALLDCFSVRSNKKETTPLSFPKKKNS